MKHSPRGQMANMPLKLTSVALRTLINEELVPGPAHSHEHAEKPLRQPTNSARLSRCQAREVQADEGVCAEWARETH